MYNYKNKEDNITQLNERMLSRTLSMFNYSDLPDTIPTVQLEKQLQKNGFTFITEVDGNLYAFTGGLGGEPNVYGEPTTITINNPALNFSKTLNIETDGVLISNDDLKLGLVDLFNRYNTLLIENEITMFLNTYNTRIQTLLSSGDDSTRESAELYLKKIIDGDLGIIGENRLFEGIKVQNSTMGNADITTQLIEMNQYLRATLFNEVGLNANFNMKRERLNSSEVDMNIDNLYPFIDNMIDNRKQGLAKVNEMFGLDIGVEFGSIWNKRNENVPRETIAEDDEPIIEPIVEPIIEPIVEPIIEPIVEDDEDVPRETITDSMLDEAYQMNVEFDEMKEG